MHEFSDLPKQDPKDMKEIRSRANELLLRAEWAQAIELYSQYINHCDAEISMGSSSSSSPPDDHELKKSLCLALCNRAEARIGLRDYENAIRDVNRALEADPSHPKSLYCKGRILLQLNQYSRASECFQRALDRQPNTPEFQEALDRGRRFESQSKTGAYDISDWVSNGYAGRPPECAEYLGPVEIRPSDVAPGERGLFVTRDVEAGTLLLVAKPVAIARAILPSPFSENCRMVIWKELVEEIQRAARRSGRVLRRIYSLSEGDEIRRGLEIPDMAIFKPNAWFECEETGPAVDMNRILRILDLNALTEKGCSAKKLAPDCYYSTENDCIGLWVLPAFLNHSCSPNSWRLHIGDSVFLHAARDLRAGEELTSAYFDVLLPLAMRRELCKTWSFECKCHRCLLEQSLEHELRPLEMEFLSICKRGGEIEMAKLGLKLEERLTQFQRQGRVRAKDRQLIRSSFASAYWPFFRSPVLLKRWGRQMPSVECIIDAVTLALPGDETALCAAAAVVDKSKVNRGSSAFQEAMDRALRICRGLYGKQMKSHVMKALIEAHVKNRGIIVPKA